MDCPAPRGTSGARALLCFLFVLALPACGIFDDGPPETARVVIDGPTGHPVSVVTSSDFDAVTSADGDSREISVFSADTTAASVPFDRSYDLGPRTRIYLIVGSDSTSALPVRVRVSIDGEPRYDRSTYFAGGAELEFVFASAGGN